MTTQTVEQGIEQRALTMVEAARLIRIVDAESYISAGEAWKRLAKMEKEAHEHFDPVVKSTDKAHKDAVALRKKVLDPIEGTKSVIKSEMSDYDTEQARIAAAETIRLEGILRKQEEEARLAEAIAAEESGQKEEAEAILAEPIQTPVVIVQKETPKVAGGPIYRTVWDAEVVDKIALVKAVAAGLVSYNALEPNATFLRQQAVSLKETMNIPGVRAYSKRV